MPGNPTINIANMPGAGGIAMLRRMYDVSPKDGTVLAMLNRVALTLAKLDPLYLFDASKNSLKYPDQLVETIR